MPWTSGVSAGEVASGPTTTGPVAPVSAYAVPRASGRRPALVGGGRRHVCGGPRPRGHRARWRRSCSASSSSGCWRRPCRPATSSAASPPCSTRRSSGCSGRSSPGWWCAACCRGSWAAPPSSSGSRSATGCSRSPCGSGRARAGGSWPGPCWQPRSRCHWPTRHTTSSCSGSCSCSRRSASSGSGRAACRRPAPGAASAGALLLGYVGVPVLLLGGALDPWLTTDPGAGAQRRRQRRGRSCA